MRNIGKMRIAISRFLHGFFVKKCLTPLSDCDNIVLVYLNRNWFNCDRVLMKPGRGIKVISCDTWCCGGFSWFLTHATIFGSNICKCMSCKQIAREVHIVWSMETLKGGGTWKPAGTGLNHEFDNNSDQSWCSPGKKGGSWMRKT